MLNNVTLTNLAKTAAEETKQTSQNTEASEEKSIFSSAAQGAKEAGEFAINAKGDTIADQIEDLKNIPIDKKGDTIGDLVDFFKEAYKSKKEAGESVRNEVKDFFKEVHKSKKEACESFLNAAKNFFKEAFKPIGNTDETEATTDEVEEAQAASDEAEEPTLSEKVVNGIISALDNLDRKPTGETVTVDGKTYKVEIVKNDDLIIRLPGEPEYKKVVVVDEVEYEVQTVKDPMACDKTKEVVIIDGKQYDVKNPNTIFNSSDVPVLDY